MVQSKFSEIIRVFNMDLIQTHDIDYDNVKNLAKKYNPKLIVAGFSAFSGIIDWKKF